MLLDMGIGDGAFFNHEFRYLDLKWPGDSSLKFHHRFADSEAAENVLVFVQQHALGHGVNVRSVFQVHADGAVGITQSRERYLAGMLIQQDQTDPHLPDLPKYDVHHGLAANQRSTLI